MEREVTLSCKPNSGHDTLFWYRQTSRQGPELLIYFRNQATIDNRGMPEDQFSAEMANKSFSTLNIRATEPGDSATYLCASSSATALQSRLLPLQKPSRFPFSLQPPPFSAVSPEQGRGVGVFAVP